MSLPDPGDSEPQEQLQLTFDGRTLSARTGQSVAAALIAAGIRSWRFTRHRGRPRGVFCGIGICYDCLITVNGVPNQRACLVVARDGMALTSAGADFSTAKGAER